MTWRWSPPHLGYRLFLLSRADPAEGGIVFRVRGRGSLVELAVAEVFAPDRKSASRLVRTALRLTHSDYAVRIKPQLTHGRVALPWRGPILVTRDLVGGAPMAREWNLSLGDIELF